jgi:hypothetical protein
LDFAVIKLRNPIPLDGIHVAAAPPIGPPPVVHDVGSFAGYGMINSSCSRPIGPLKMTKEVVVKCRSSQHPGLFCTAGVELAREPKDSCCSDAGGGMVINGRLVAILTLDNRNCVDHYDFRDIYPHRMFLSLEAHREQIDRLRNK